MMASSNLYSANSCLLVPIVTRMGDSTLVLHTKTYDEGFGVLCLKINSIRYINIYIEEAIL